MKVILKQIQLVMALVAGLALSTFTFAEEYIEGKHYKVVENMGIPEVPGKIEVREFFWYGCPHCYSLEGYLGPWKKQLADDVNFVKSPALVVPNWRTLGTAYLAAKSLGVAEQGHSALFDTIHKDGKFISTPEQAAEFYSQYGVSKGAFLDAMNSFSVKTEARKAENLFRQYKFTGVPAIVVNGKYQPTSGNYDELLRIVDYLVEKERQEILSR